jgi:ERCC4-type nuclease
MTETNIKMINSVENATIMGWGIPIIWTANYVDTARKVAELYQRSEKKSEKPRATVHKEREPESIRLSMLQCVEGCGPMTAQRILEKYKLCDLVDVHDPTVLVKSVVGLRRDVANRIVNVFNGVKKNGK